MATRTIETRNLARRFGGLRAVDSLTLSIEAGEIFGLMGPNGGGKTTTIKMLTTLLPPSSGTARVGGFDIVRNAGEVRRVIGYVPQMPSVDGSLTGYENLLISAKLYDIPPAGRDARLREALARIGLADAGSRLARNYSGGMVRRLEIAQATLHRPRVLFLDEPTVGLDPLARLTVWEMLRQLRRDHGTTIFITTHYMEEADELCERIGIMHQGRVAAIGSPRELKVATGNPRATLDDVFVHFAGAAAEPAATVEGNR